MPGAVSIRPRAPPYRMPSIRSWPPFFPGPRPSTGTRRTRTCSIYSPTRRTAGAASCPSMCRARTKRNKKSWAAMMAWPASTVWNAVTCIADANCKKSADRCRRDLNPDTGPLLQGARALPAYAYSSSQRKKCSANTNRGNPLTAAAETRTRIPPLPLRGEVHVVDSYAH